MAQTTSKHDPHGTAASVNGMANEPKPLTPHAELIETLQEILSALDRIEDHLAPKPLVVQR